MSSKTNKISTFSKPFSNCRRLATFSHIHNGFPSNKNECVKRERERALLNNLYENVSDGNLHKIVKNGKLIYFVFLVLKHLTRKLYFFSFSFVPKKMEKYVLDFYTQKMCQKHKQAKALESENKVGWVFPQQKWIFFHLFSSLLFPSLSLSYTHTYTHTLSTFHGLQKNYVITDFMKRIF